MIELPTIEIVKPRIIEAAEIDAKGLLRPLLLYRGSVSEGRIRSLWNVVLTMMDANVASVSEGVKLVRSAHDYRHVCGVHAKQVDHFSFNGILSRLDCTPKVSSLIPGLREYVEHLAFSRGATVYQLEPIAEYALRVRSDRIWRLMPGHMRPVRQARPALSEYYPYVSGAATSEHDMLMAVDAIVPKGLPNDIRCDVCQDMIVAVLSGDATVDNLRGDLKKYLSQFWKMFPEKYGHISLDGVVPGTTDLKWGDRLSAKTSRLVSR